MMFIVDLLMEEVPGLNNDNVKLDGVGLDNVELLNANPLLTERTKLDASRYHRSYKLGQKDAMGIENTQRSFSDRLYVALTEQDKMAGLSLDTDAGKIDVKVSYAFPFEVVFMTPLANWNPYGIPHKDNCAAVKGSGTKASPYDATCPSRFFRTPQTLFTDATTCGKVLYGEEAFYFLNPTGDEPVCLVASGIRTVLPPIHGQNLGIRQRFPISPVFKDGNPAAKKLDAMEDSIGITLKNLVSKVSFETAASTSTEVKEHTHHVRLSLDQYKDLQKGSKIKVDYQI